MENYRTVSRNAWAYLAKNGCDSSLAYGPEEFKHARKWLDANGWIPWRRVHSVLCLACGGGQQALLFASLGHRVTLLDISPEQLGIDREVAERYGLEVECVEGDMQNLSSLYGRDFDLVYQAVSACYVPDVRRVYQEIFKVLIPHGYYQVQHWNPVHVQLAENRAWDGQAYRVARPQVPGDPVPSPLAWDEQTGETSAKCWHYIHPLHHLIGGLCEAGFSILRFAESSDVDPSAKPGSHSHLAAYLPSFFSMFARRRESTVRSVGKNAQDKG
jgi:SAM-dependent methyltransferase